MPMTFLMQLGGLSCDSCDQAVLRVTTVHVRSTAGLLLAAAGQRACGAGPPYNSAIHILPSTCYWRLCTLVMNSGNGRIRTDITDSDRDPDCICVART